MKHHYLLITALVAMLSATAVSAQDYTLFVDFDKKVIKVDSLGLPPSFKVKGVLQMLPELLERPGETLINDYDVKIEDMSVGDNADVVLNQLQLADVDRIEVSEDPVSSYQNSSQSGSINIILKNKRGTWGSASIDGTTETDLTPQFLINHNTGKFLVRGIVLGELYNTSFTETTTTGNSSSSSTRDKDFKTELARVYMLYNPTDKDELKLNLSESYSRNKETLTGANNLEKVTTLKSFFAYKHKYNSHSEFVTEWQYNYVPQKTEQEKKYNMIEAYDRNNNSDTQNSLGGKVEYKKNLLPTTGSNYADLIFGANGNFTNRDKEFTPEFEIGGETFNSVYYFATKSKTYQLTPYFNFESRFGNLKFKLAAEYQYYRYDVDRQDSGSVTINRSDFTGKLMLAWQFKPNQHLRLIVDRKIQRPSNEQIYPYKVFDLDSEEEVMGNSGLAPTLSHEFSLDYISNYAWDGRTLTLNAGVSYNLVSDIISSKTVGSDYLQRYITYHNVGDNKLWNGNLMALYNYKAFFLSFAANVFRNDFHLDENNNGDEENSHSYYYNLSLMPSFSLKSGWFSSVNLSYYSKVEKGESELGDCLAGHLKVGKNFGHWNVHCYGILSFTGKTKNITGNTVTNYELVKNNVGIGCMYHF